MKFIALGAFALLFIFYLVGKSQSNADSNLNRLDRIFDNAGNKQQFRIGKAADLESSYRRFKEMDEEAVQEALANEDLNLYEISNALLMLANKQFQDNRIDQGMKAITAAANDYHNPMAMVQLARIAYHGDQYGKMLPEGSNLDIRTDLGKAFYYVNRSFESCRILHDATGQKFALDLCVANGLGLLDSFQLQEVKAKFDHQTDGQEAMENIQKDLVGYAKMYHLN